MLGDAGRSPCQISFIKVGRAGFLTGPSSDFLQQFHAKEIPVKRREAQRRSFCFPIAY